MKSILLDIKDSLVVLICIFSYVTFFGIAGYFIFRSDFEGYAIFISPGESLYSMMILLTTANFPDVMLPAYNADRINVLFFLAYLIVGLYFLQNILLAIIFDNYKKRITKRVEDRTENRVENILKYFDKCDREKK